MKNDTKKGKLHKKLFTCLNKPPENDKRTQTTNTFKDYNCQCMHNKRKRRSRGSISPKTNQIETKNYNSDNEQEDNLLGNFTSHAALKDSKVVSSEPAAPDQPQVPSTNQPTDPQEPDELMMQLERMFHGDTTNDDELYESVLYDKFDTTGDTNLSVTSNKDSVTEDHAAQIKSLDERLANLTGIIVNNDSNVPKTDTKKKRSGTSKWLCEEYFLKQKLYELLDQIRDIDRKEIERVCL